MFLQGTIGHPFLLADNRHFTFYLWKNLLAIPARRYFLLPAYVVGLATRRYFCCPIFARGAGACVHINSN